MSSSKDLPASHSSPQPEDLKTSLDDCMVALDLFLNNRFDESLEKFKLKIEKSMYHALMYATILEVKAVMTFERADINNAYKTMKEVQEICQRLRRKLPSGSQGKETKESISEVALHAEVCYAECQLQRVALTFLQYPTDKDIEDRKNDQWWKPSKVYLFFLCPESSGRSTSRSTVES
nr:PREDICTED: tetratricopeptide repeat protein 39A-like [Latimeria chalumnae]|eukprot:XP_005994220.1 PREDICTED: tetratricopeptide repeat protein 39A-like [Latimeria chalumnae]